MGQRPQLQIGRHTIGPGRATYLIAELGCNHGGDFARAQALVQAAKDCGADAVKLQTFTADTITLDCAADCFQIRGPTGQRSLHDLYAEVAMPWAWQPKLKVAAEALGLDFFSSPFDPTAVEFLEQLHVPAYKIASFELIDLPLIERVAATGKPVILSTGMASLEEIREAVATVRRARPATLVAADNDRGFALLKCVSTYPADPADMHLATLAHMAETFHCVVGVSDHTPGIEVPIAAVALGACIIEKHFTLRRADGGPDAAVSLEPAEFQAMTAAVRNVEKAIGSVTYGKSVAEAGSVAFRRSLFVVQDVARGEAFTAANVRSIRPGLGLAPKYLPQVLGRRATQDLPRGTPVRWELVQ